MQIPIQLDTLCYTWEEFDNEHGSETVPNTITGMYKAIKRRLWEKDVSRLGRDDDKLPLPTVTDDKTEPIKRFLKCLAFNGLYSEVINFTLKH
jgi:hypothetical protein